MSRHVASISRRRIGMRDEAVSPVIGTVLILLISVMAIGGLLSWGLPAIQALQNHASFQSTQTQFLELNQDLRNLRDPQNTRVAVIGISEGTISVGPGDRWVITAAVDNTYLGFKISSYEDDDSAINVVGNPVDGTASAFRVIGGDIQEVHSVACPAGGCALDLSQGPGASLANNVVQVQFEESGVIRAESWIMNVGRITYEQAGGINLNHLEMGASIIEQNGRLYMRQTPTVKEPVFVTVPQDLDFFVRAIQVTGTDSDGGRGEFSVVVNLVENYGGTRGRPLFSDFHVMRFQVNGTLEEAFCYHFLAEDDNYMYGGGGLGCSSGDADVVYESGTPLTFEMSHAQVNAFVRSI